MFCETHVHRALLTTCLLYFIPFCSLPIFAQHDSIQGETRPYSLVMEPISNPGNQRNLVFEELIDAGTDVPWLSVNFSAANLPEGSYVEITSLLDGEAQRLSALHLQQWQYGTGFFNGHQVTVAVYAGPQTTDNFVQVSEILVGIPPQPGEARSICGTDDDRVPASNAAVARMLNAQALGCTGFIINEEIRDDKCMLTAGHCFLSANMIKVEFDVPQSNADCSLVHPPMSKQFAIDLTSMTAVNTGIGNDWSVFRVFPNPNTGKTAFEEQNAALNLANLTPTDPALEIIGYGVDSNNNATGGANSACSTCVPANMTGQRHKVLQSATGTRTSISGDRLNHNVDTCGANSGSPVLIPGDDAFAIHTNGGCDTGTPTNAATLITNNNLENAIETCTSGPFVAIVIDRTGSMNVGGPPNRCDAAITRARAQINQLRASNLHSAFAIWTFSGNSFTPISDGFLDYTSALAAMDTVPGCGGLTNLADALCSAINELAAIGDPGDERRLVFLTDGDENNSNGPCSGPASTSSTPPYDPGSWHSNVRSKALAENIITDTDFYGATVRATIDVETGLQRGFLAVEDLAFFQELADATGGTLTVFDDDNLGIVPTLSSVAMVIMIMLLMSFGLIQMQRKKKAAC